MPCTRIGPLLHQFVTKPYSASSTPTFSSTPKTKEACGIHNYRYKQQEDLMACVKAQQKKEAKLTFMVSFFFIFLLLCFAINATRC